MSANELNLAQQSTLPPELFAQQQALNRQQQMAQLLMQQNQQPQGQMVSGRYVPTSFFQNIAPVANMLTGAYLAKQGDTEAAKLAEQLRTGRLEGQKAIMEKINANDIKGALALAQQDQYGAGKELLPALVANVIPKAQESKVVGNYLIGPDGKVVFKAPKEYAPHAPQLVPVAGGFAEYNPNTKTLTPIGNLAGGTGALMPPLPAPLQAQASAINEQKSTINDVLKSVEGNRQYFGAKYAVPSLLGGELGAAKMNEKLPSEAVEARSQVFNTASSVIKERAGTAQSKQEKETIMRFLPSEFDSDKVVIDKLNGFNKYLESKEKGISPVVGAVATYRPGTTSNAPSSKSGIPAGVTEAQWNVMTPEEKAAFK